MWELFLSFVSIVFFMAGCLTYEAREVPIKTVRNIRIYRHILILEETAICPCTLQTELDKRGGSTAASLFIHLPLKTFSCNS